LGAILEERSNALFAFKTFKNELEKKTGKIIKILRSNNGGEYISNEFFKYYQDIGIKKHFIHARTPQ